MPFTVNNVELPEHAYYDLISAVRGPDETKSGHAVSPVVIHNNNMPNWEVAHIFKGVTSVVVRRALFGAEKAAAHSSPTKPAWPDFFALEPDNIYGALPYHYVTHMIHAMNVLDKYQCALPEDRESVALLMRKWIDAGFHLD